MSTYLYAKTWRHEQLHGDTRTVPAAPTRAHIVALLDAGWSVRGIAEVAGLSPSVVSRLRRGQQDRVHRDTARVVADVDAAAIRARATGTGFVLKLGAVRRIQALLAIGHRHADITAAMRTHTPAMRTGSMQVIAQRGVWVNRATHDAICAAYEQLAMRPGCCLKTRTLSAGYGYAPPLAWDEDALDDPVAVPVTTHRPDAEVDEVLVARLMAGTQAYVPRTGVTPELIEAIARLTSQRFTDRQIGELIGASRDAVLKMRSRYGIPTAYSQERTA